MGEKGSSTLELCPKMLTYFEEKLTELHTGVYHHKKGTA
jgi:hypothetical protein